jgi:hypothetical protein
MLSPTTISGGCAGDMQLEVMSNSISKNISITSKNISITLITIGFNYTFTRIRLSGNGAILTNQVITVFHNQVWKWF